MKIKLIVILSAILFVSCEDAYKQLQDNLGQYNTGTSYVNRLYDSIKEVKNNPNGVKASAQNMIEYADSYLTYYGKDVPTSLDGVNSINNAMLYYLSISKQIALLTSDFAGKAENLTFEEAEEQYYSKLDQLVDAEMEAITRWEDLQEKYAKDHGITLVDFDK